MLCVLTSLIKAGWGQHRSVLGIFSRHQGSQSVELREKRREAAAIS